MKCFNCGAKLTERNGILYHPILKLVGKSCMAECPTYSRKDGRYYGKVGFWNKGFRI